MLSFYEFCQVLLEVDPKEKLGGSARNDPQNRRLPAGSTPVVGDTPVSVADDDWGRGEKTTGVDIKWNNYVKDHPVKDMAKNPELAPLRKQFEEVGNLLNTYLNQTWNHGDGTEEGYWVSVENGLMQNIYGEDMGHLDDMMAMALWFCSKGSGNPDPYIVFENEDGKEIHFGDYRQLLKDEFHIKHIMGRRRRKTNRR